jgi:Tfp pilus assembly protein PilF
VASDYQVLGELYDIQGEYKLAEQNYDTALDIRVYVLGPDDPDVAAVLEKLAVIYQKTGREAKARDLERRVAEIKLNEA